MTQPSKFSPLPEEMLEELARELRRRHGRNGELVRWVVGLLLAGLLSYLTTIATMDKSIGEVKTTENNHFEEVLRQLSDIKVDIRELRNAR